MTHNQAARLKGICVEWISEHVPPYAENVAFAVELHAFALYLADVTFAGAWEQRCRDGENDAREGD